MKELTRYQVWNMSLEEVIEINNQWRTAIKRFDKNYKSFRDINKYIIDTYPEISYQFLWETFTANRREQERSGFNTLIETTFKDLFDEKD